MASTIKVNNIQNQCGANIINESANTITIGASGDTITLACGASQTGFGRTGTVDWDTTAKTASFTAVSGVGYFVNTTSGEITVTTPASPSAGDIFSLSDYTRTWQTNSLILAPNGTDKIGGVNSNATLNTEGQSVTFVYVDATEGWINVQDSTSAVQGRLVTPYIVATGGTVTCCGDYKIHTFTGPGTFTVTNEGTPAGSTTVDYMVVAGGGGGSTGNPGAGAGGGAGGFRESSGTASGCYTTSPLGACVSALPVSLTGYPITVGAGGSGGTQPVPTRAGGKGSNSVFSTITSTGGGGGIDGPSSPVPIDTKDGGSGAGAAGGYGPCAPVGTGNTPPVSPPQGNNGGLGSPGASSRDAGGGGGGATVAGGNGSNPGPGGPGGNGATTSISSSPTAYAGGGGGGKRQCAESTPGGVGGTGGGGDGALGNAFGGSGTANTGGGGGASGYNSGTAGCGGAGGSGVVIIRYKYQ